MLSIKVNRLLLILLCVVPSFVFSIKNMPSVIRDAHKDPQNAVAIFIVAFIALAYLMFGLILFYTSIEMKRSSRYFTLGAISLFLCLSAFYFKRLFL